jgi:hypothetical protein
MQSLAAEMTEAQERRGGGQKLRCAICVLSQWTLEQIWRYQLSSGGSCLAKLDRIGIIELNPEPLPPEAGQNLRYTAP